MRYLLRCSGTESERNWCWYAIVDLDVAAVAELRARRAAWALLHATDSDLDTLEYFDSRAVYYSSIEDDSGTEVLCGADAATLEDRGWIVVEDGWAPPGEPDRTEIDRVVIGERDVLWRCGPKYTDDQVETWPIAWSDLRADGEIEFAGDPCEEHIHVSDPSCDTCKGERS